MLLLEKKRNTKTRTAQSSSRDCWLLAATWLAALLSQVAEPQGAHVMCSGPGNV